MSSVTIQSTQSDTVPTPTNEANEFQYGPTILQSHQAEDASWAENFEDPLPGLLQHNDPKMMATEWMDHDSLGFLDHQEETVIPHSNGLPITPPTTAGSLPNGSEDAWKQSCEQPHDFSHPETFACEIFPPSPEPPKTTELAIQRLLDLQSRLFSRHMTKAQELDGLSALISTTVHSTETLIEIVEGLPLLRPSVEGRRSVSPLSSWGTGSNPAGFNAPAAPYAAPEQPPQQTPNYAVTISLFITCYLVLLDSYDELLSALRARLQCSRQSQGPSPARDMGLAQTFFSNNNNNSGGNLNKFNLVSSFDLDVNSVVFLLSRMMKQLHKSTESRFAAVSMENPAFNHIKGQQNHGGYPVAHGLIGYEFQDGASQDTDGISEPSPGAFLSPMMMMGNYALREVSQRHQSVMESLRVIRWLADEL